jgi:hypothetical protein
MAEDEDRGLDAWRGTAKGNKEVDIGKRHEAQRLYGKQFVYYTIRLAFNIPSIIVSCNFSQALCSKRKEKAP